MTTLFASRNSWTCPVPSTVKTLKKQKNKKQKKQQKNKQQQYIHDANSNSGTTIFQIRILAQFVSHDFLK